MMREMVLAVEVVRRELEAHKQVLEKAAQALRCGPAEVVETAHDVRTRLDSALEQCASLEHAQNDVLRVLRGELSYPLAGIAHAVVDALARKELNGMRDRTALEREVESLRGQLDAAEAFHRLAVAERNAARAQLTAERLEVEELQATVRKLMSENKTVREQAAVGLAGPRSYVHEDFHLQMLKQVAKRQMEADRANVSSYLLEVVLAPPVPTDTEGLLVHVANAIRHELELPLVTEVES